MAVVIITGVPGVGKSTVIDAAQKAKGYKVVVYGTEMLEVAKAMGLVKDRDEMRKLEPSVQRDIQEEAARRIAELGDVIVDTHCTIKTPRGYLPGIPAWVAESLQPKQIILVEAPPKDIISRRNHDPTRHRDPDSEDDVAAHQAINRSAAVAIAALTGATVAVVVNKTGDVDGTRDQIVRILG
jgi:adenylate kinase